MHFSIPKDGPLVVAALDGDHELVERLCSNSNCEANRSDAYQLLGATKIDENNDFESGEFFWRLSVAKDRVEINDLTIVNTDLSVSPLGPSLFFSEDMDRERMIDVALNMREKILRRGHPLTTYYMVHRGHLYADSGNYSRCLELWERAARLRFAVLKDFIGQGNVFQDELCRLTADGETDNSVMEDKRLMDALVETFEHFSEGLVELITIFRLVDEVIFKSQSQSCSDHSVALEVSLRRHLVQDFVNVVIFYVCLILQQRHRLNATELARFKKALRKLIEVDIRLANGSTLLHVVCAPLFWHPNAGLDSIRSETPIKELLSLLIELGAETNSFDYNRNTPLHVAASRRPVQPEVIRLLLENGAHPDLSNWSRNTFVDLLPRCGDESFWEMGTSRFRLDWVSLKCAAARCIAKSGIDYERLLPTELSKFVAMH